MKNRRLLSYILFAAGVAAFLIVGYARNWGAGLLVGLAFEVVGFIFYRRAS